MSQPISIEKLAQEATSVVDWLRAYDPLHPDYSQTDWIEDAPEVTETSLQSFIDLCVERRSAPGTMSEPGDHDFPVRQYESYFDSRRFD